jgi:hypothetical protein
VRSSYADVLRWLVIRGRPTHAVRGADSRAFSLLIGAIRTRAAHRTTRAVYALGGSLKPPRTPRRRSWQRRELALAFGGILTTSRVNSRRRLTLRSIWRRAWATFERVRPLWPTFVSHFKSALRRLDPARRKRGSTPTRPMGSSGAASYRKPNRPFHALASLLNLLSIPTTKEHRCRVT